MNLKKRVKLKQTKEGKKDKGVTQVASNNGRVIVGKVADKIG